MKILNKILVISITLFVFLGCKEEEPEFGAIVAPTNLQVSFSIQGQDDTNPYGDGTGFVNLTASADNALAYKFNFGDGSNEEVSQIGNATHQFFIQGINTYIVTVIATGTGGISTSTTVELEVFSAFEDNEVTAFLTGTPLITDPVTGSTSLDLSQASSKTWYWAANLPLHVGLGPVEDDYGGGEFAWEAWWNSIQPWDNEKFCMYADKFVFTLNPSGTMSFEQTEGPAYIPGAYAGVIGLDGELCYDETTVPSMTGLKTVTLSPSNSKAAIEGGYNNEPYRGTSFEISEGGFMGWYVGSSRYDIIYMDDEFLKVRVIQDGSIYPDGGYAWYLLFTSEDPLNSGNPNELQTEYENLIWSEEFDVDGAPDNSIWSYEIGTGTNGWGNNESQYYTDRPENVVVENDALKITAKAEQYMGSNYTSSRIKTQDNFAFQNGRIEIRAKLPEGGGTWPALWLLGSNFPTAGWPFCGEMDIMEHVGNNQDLVLGTLHWNDGANFNPASFSQNTNVENATTEFHTYTLEWRDDEILIAVDNQVYYTFGYDASFPFNQDFFIIVNIAMGGTLGGTIDSNFSEAIMEVDYIRVYQ